MRYVVLVWIIALSCGVSGCGDGRSQKTIPDNMTGTWGTNASKYRHCKLVIKPNAVSFINAKESHSVRYLVKRVNFTTRDQDEIVEVHYSSESTGKGSFSFVLKGSELLFYYTKDSVWTRQD